MKMPISILRKMELKIYQVVALEEIRKSSLTETQQKLTIGKTPPEEPSRLK